MGSRFPGASGAEVGLSSSYPEAGLPGLPEKVGSRLLSLLQSPSTRILQPLIDCSKALDPRDSAPWAGRSGSTTNDKTRSR